MTPKLSIVLPVYNGEDYIATCIKSVLAQDYDDFELLVGDNLSTDSTPDIVKGFDDARIRYFRWDVNLGLTGNLNQLTQQASAPLIRLLGHDDVLEPHCVSATVRCFDEYPEIGLMFGRIVFIDADGAETERQRRDAFPEILGSGLALQLFYYYNNFPGNISNVAFRKAAYDAVGPFSQDYGNAVDYDMWVRIAERYPLGALPDHLVRVRRHQGQLSRTGASPYHVVDARTRIHQRLLRQLPQSRQPDARRYHTRRFGVAWFHLALRWLLVGKTQHFLDVIRLMGLGKTIQAAFYWLFTINNRLYHPVAVIEIDRPDIQLNMPHQQLVYQKQATTQTL